LSYDTDFDFEDEEMRPIKTKGSSWLLSSMNHAQDSYESLPGCSDGCRSRPWKTEAPSRIYPTFLHPVAMVPGFFRRSRNFLKKT